MLIEDDKVVARGIKMMLKAEGFNVYVTDLGEEGVDLGKIYDYELILLDLNLPDMSGMDVLRTLRMAPDRHAYHDPFRQPGDRVEGQEPWRRRRTTALTKPASTAKNWWPTSTPSSAGPRATPIR